MADFIVKRSGPGVAIASSADPFSSLAIYRIDRSHWKETPAEAGVYVLWGVAREQAAIYVGMSTTNMRARIGSHHVNARKHWFGTLFAIPLSAALCPAVEAELLQRVAEAGVVGMVDNRATEERWLNADVVHVEPAVEQVIDALQLLMGTDAFSGQVDLESDATVETVERIKPLSRVYRGRAFEPRARLPIDPPEATHASVGIPRGEAWGRFEGDEPDLRFRVLEGSTWIRGKTPDPTQATHDLQSRVLSSQQELVEAGVLDEEARAYARDHVFTNWTHAARITRGVGQYSGAYTWQRLAS